MAKRGKLQIEGARIFWKNFSGKGSQYNAEGSRNFCLELDNETAERLEADGWNVKYSKPREEGDEPQPYIQVSVVYGNYPPKIYLVTSRNKTLLDEDTVGELDRAEIENVDLIVSPYHWRIGQPGTKGYKEGIKAYTDVMYVTIHEDDFARKYADIADDIPEELPFN